MTEERTYYAHMPPWDDKPSRPCPLLWNHKTRKFERYVWKDQR